MLKTYKEEILIRTSMCDFNGQWRPTAILEAMQETAGTHAELLGVGRNALLNKNIVWIITRTEVHMDRYPSVGERICIETFPMAVRRWFCPRYFRFIDESGTEIGFAGTLWALLDINDRKMVSPEPVLPFFPDNTDLVAPMGLPATVQNIIGQVATSVFMPVYTDLDVNGHVNNTKYMDWCCNALGIDAMREKQVKNFSINYNSEILPGQEVRTELSVKDDAFSYTGFHQGVRCFDVGGTLTDRL
ncbi:MAG: thioesterase [Clostridia bacterium]|nr:thioesterase [Clostridia bacterium]